MRVATLLPYLSNPSSFSHLYLLSSHLTTSETTANCINAFHKHCTMEASSRPEAPPKSPEVVVLRTFETKKCTDYAKARHGKLMYLLSKDCIAWTMITLRSPRSLNSVTPATM